MHASYLSTYYVNMQNQFVKMQDKKKIKVICKVYIVLKKEHFFEKYTN